MYNSIKISRYSNRAVSNSNTTAIYLSAESLNKVEILNVTLETPHEYHSQSSSLAVETFNWGTTFSIRMHMLCMLLGMPYIIPVLQMKVLES